MGKSLPPSEGNQALPLRHLSRIQWNRLPRPLQLEGFRNLRKLLSEMRSADPYPVALTLVQNWIPQELSSPDWGELLETTHLLKKLSESTAPLFEKQNIAARVALETIFGGPILENLMERFHSPEGNDENIRKLFRELGQRAAPFLFQKIEGEETGNLAWKKAVEILESFESEGLEVYEAILDWPEKRAEVEKFLEIFQAVPPRVGLEEYFERHWNSFSPAAQGKILAVVRQWNRRNFRPLLERLLGKPESPIALEALDTLAQVGMEGDGQTIVAAVQRYPLHGKDRENFWIKACRALGALADAPTAAALMEWAGKYKFMENKKGRTLEVKRAALEALGRFRLPEVKDFLAELRNESEKELRPDVEQALKSVDENLGR